MRNILLRHSTAVVGDADDHIITAFRYRDLNLYVFIVMNKSIAYDVRDAALHQLYVDLAFCLTFLVQLNRLVVHIIRRCIADTFLNKINDINALKDRCYLSFQKEIARLQILDQFPYAFFRFEHLPCIIPYLRRRIIIILVIEQFGISLDRR